MRIEEKPLEYFQNTDVNEIFTCPECGKVDKIGAFKIGIKICEVYLKICVACYEKKKKSLPDDEAERYQEIRNMTYCAIMEGEIVNMNNSENDDQTEAEVDNESDSHSN